MFGMLNEEKEKAEDEIMDTILNILANNGEKRAGLLKVSREFDIPRRKLLDMAIEKKLSDEKMDVLISLFNQFKQLLEAELKAQEEKR